MLSFADTWRERLPGFLLLVAMLAVFGLQSDKVGFEPGHAGWVSSQHLAIITDSTRENGFVGHACDFVHGNGQVQAFYFNRSPPLFYGAVQTLLSPLKGDLAGYIHWAHQIMNLVFVLTLFLSYRLMRLILRDRWHALAVTLAAFSGYYLLHYKDLVEQNRLSALAIVLVIYAIARFERDGRKLPLLLLVGAAALVGEAPPAIFVVSLWAAFSWVRLVMARKRVGAGARVPVVPLSAFVVAFGVTGAAILYNVLQEAEYRQVGILETQIVDSAMRRTVGANKQAEAGDGTFAEFAREQGRRVVRGMIPYPYSRQLNPKVNWQRQFNPSPAALAAGLAVGFALVAFMLWRWRREFPLTVLLLLPASGVFYLFMMRNLSAPHDFTAVSYIGLFLAFWTGVVLLLRRLPALVPAVLAMGLFVYSVSKLQLHQGYIAQRVNPVTQDLQRVADRIGPGPRVVHVEGGYRQLLPGVPYALCFMLTDHKLTDAPGLGEFTLTKNPSARGESLTPENDHVWLLEGASESGR